MKIQKTGLVRVLVFLFGFSVCVLGTELAWPGYTVDGHFYSYPVTGLLLAAVAGWWLLVLGTTFFVLKKIGREDDPKASTNKNAGDECRLRFAASASLSFPLGHLARHAALDTSYCSDCRAYGDSCAVADFVRAAQLAARRVLALS